MVTADTRFRARALEFQQLPTPRLATAQVRDLQRGRLMAYGDRLAAYGWFLLLSFSTFPLTPLLIPSIDKRRDGQQVCCLGD